jgi:hypothetical protein
MMPLAPLHLRRLAAGACALAAATLLAVTLPTPDSAGQSSNQSNNQSNKQAKPQEEQPEHFPDGPNREDTFYFCTACHGFKLVAAQGMSRARWDETLDVMVTRHNMPDVQGEERAKMLDYLERAFPESKQPGGWKNPFAPG